MVLGFSQNRILKIYLIELRRSLILATPIMIGQLGQMAIHMTDSMMIGQLGRIPLAATSFVGSLFSFLMVFVVATLTFIMTMVAQYRGAQKADQCGETLRAGFLVATVLSSVLVALAFWSTPYLHIFDQPPEVIEASIPYLKTLMLSFPFMAYFFSLKQFSEGLGETWTPFYHLVFAILLNIFLNWIFIFGNLGAPALGLLGAGLSTLAVRGVMFVSLLIHLFSKRRIRKYMPSHWFFPLSLNVLKRGLSLGIPSGMQGLFEVGIFAFSGVMMGWIGAKALASHQIALSLGATTFMVSLGMGFAANIRVGYAIGRRNLKAARRIGFGLILSSVVIMTLFGIVFVLFRNYLPYFFIQDDIPVIELAATLILVAAFFQIFDGTQVVAISALRGLGDVKTPTVIALFSYWGIGFPICYLLGFNFELGAVGIWIGLAISLASAAILLNIRFHLQTKSS